MRFHSNLLQNDYQTDVRRRVRPRRARLAAAALLAPPVVSCYGESATAYVPAGRSYSFTVKMQECHRNTV